MEPGYWQFCRKSSLQVLGIQAVGLASVLLLLLLLAMWGLGQLGMLLGTPASSLLGGFSAGPEPGCEEARLDKVESSTRTPAAPQHRGTALSACCRASSVHAWCPVGSQLYRLAWDWPPLGPALSCCRPSILSCVSTLGTPWLLHRGVVGVRRFQVCLPQAPYQLSQFFCG